MTQSKTSSVSEPDSWMMAAAAIHSATVSSVSSRAAPIALTSALLRSIFGVRKNGLLRVTRPAHIALAMVCDSASPASAAASVCLAVPTM